MGVRSGQGAFEYILLLAGILLLVILVVVVLRSSVIAQTNAGIQNQLNIFGQLTNVPPIDGLLFAAHFNGNLLSHRGEAPNNSSGVTFPAGRFSSGANVSANAVLNYTTGGNLNPKEGTLALWARLDTALSPGTISTRG